MFVVYMNCGDPFVCRICVLVPENVSPFMDNDFVFKCYTVLGSVSV